MDKWQIAAAIATIVQGVVVVVSLIFIWRQVSLQTKQISIQTKLAKTANTQSIVGLSSPFNLDDAAYILKSLQIEHSDSRCGLLSDFRQEGSAKAVTAICIDAR